MRQRITFIHDSDADFSTKQLQTFHGGLKVDKVKASREDRLTFGFQELPQELWTVLKQCHEIHIRWISTDPYHSTSPFVSRLSPGLHILFTPQQGHSNELLCPLLKKVFGDHLKCSNPESSFIALPILSERFAHSAATQYYQLAPSLEELITYIQQKICPLSDEECSTRADALRSVSYLDIDYDAISHALTLTGHWANSPEKGWTEKFRKVEGSDSIEVGVLTNEKSIDPEDIKLGGWLTVAGETDPTSTLFSFPSRHHPYSGASFAVSFQTPTGLHPTLEITLPSSLAYPGEKCALLSYITLPSYIFADKYQFSDELFLASKKLMGLRMIAGETDLEAPDWMIEKWGSSLLVELALPETNEPEATGNWTAEIPLHFRYLSPDSGGTSHVDFPWPTVFWACVAEEGSKMPVNPFDRVNLGFDGLFGPKTMFYHIEPNPDPATNSTLIEKLQIPVLDSDRTGLVEMGTVAVIAMGFLWICWKLLKPVKPRSIPKEKLQ